MSVRRRTAFRNWVEYLAVATVAATLRFTPRWMAERLGRGYAGLLDRLAPRLRRTGLRNLELALPELSSEERNRIADGVFRSVARLLVGASRLPSISRRNVREWIDYDGSEYFQEAKRRGRGVLIASGHLGNWELSGVGHALLSGETMSVVVRPLDNPLIDRLVKNRRELTGNRMIGKKELIRSVLEELKRNGTVGIFVDQNSQIDKDVFVDFFGVPARSGTTFAKLAAHTGATVLPGFAVWIEAERRYRLKFYPPLDLTGDVAEDTQRVQSAVERAVREYPDQWLWIHRRWKARPPGAPALYD
ncbi:MAG: lysophospholipid acyltransferase family protein [Bryobacteraceae bacterium]